MRGGHGATTEIGATTRSPSIVHAWLSCRIDYIAMQQRERESIRCAKVTSSKAQTDTKTEGAHAQTYGCVGVGCVGESSKRSQAEEQKQRK